MQDYRTLGLGLLLAGLGAVVGCSGGIGEVTGQVRYKGEPLPSGRVSFVCEGGDRPVLTAEIKNGEYVVSRVPVGQVRIGVATFGVNTTPVPNMPENILPPGGGTGPTPGTFVPIPSRYGDPNTSGLDYTVGRGKQTHDIDLEP
jgi:hypothetical protein